MKIVFFLLREEILHVSETTKFYQNFFYCYSISASHILNSKSFDSVSSFFSNLFQFFRRAEQRMSVEWSVRHHVIYDRSTDSRYHFYIALLTRTQLFLTKSVFLPKQYYKILQRFTTSSFQRPRAKVL